VHLAVDVVGRDAVELAGAELGEEVAVDDAAVVLDGGVVALPDVPDVAEVLGGGVRERRAGDGWGV
jgi:hypothetical protein